MPFPTYNSFGRLSVANEPTREYATLDFDARSASNGNAPVAPDVLSVLDSWGRLHVAPCADRTLERWRQVEGDGMHDPRVIGLIAQSDPVLLARILALANSSLADAKRAVDSGEDAIRIIGPLLAIASIRELAVPSRAALDPLSAGVRNELLARSVSVGLTARRVARYIGLARRDATMLYLAALIDGLGPLAALEGPAPQSDAIAQALRPLVSPGEAIALGSLESIAGYRLLSAALARSWSAPDAVILALEQPHGEAGRLLTACEALVVAKRTGRDQAAALFEALPDRALPDVYERTVDVDLAYVSHT